MSAITSAASQRVSITFVAATVGALTVHVWLVVVRSMCAPFHAAFRHAQNMFVLHTAGVRAAPAQNARKNVAMNLKITAPSDPHLKDNLIET